MSRQVIKQPDGRYAVFSTGTDRWVAVNLTRDEYIEWRAEQAAREARADAARLLDDVDAGLVYSGYTFEEANAESVEHGGEDLSGKLAGTGGSMRIDDTKMSSGLTRHTAELVKLPSPLTGWSWQVTWLPGRHLSRNQAITAMVLAERVATNDLTDNQHPLWGHIDGWASELGMSGPDAVSRASESPEGALERARDERGTDGQA